VSDPANAGVGFEHVRAPSRLVTPADVPPADKSRVLELRRGRRAASWPVGERAAALDRNR
jgi:hypothetical protein